MHFRILGVGVLTFPHSSSPLGVRAKSSQCSVHCHSQSRTWTTLLLVLLVPLASCWGRCAVLPFLCHGGCCWSAAPSFPLTAFLLWPSPSRRGPRTAKGGLIDHLTCSSSVFIHPSGSTFSLAPLFFFSTTLNLHSSFRRNNGVVLSCTLCGEICSAVYLSITYPSLGLFSI